MHLPHRGSRATLSTYAIPTHTHVYRALGLRVSAFFEQKANTSPIQAVAEHTSVSKKKSEGTEDELYAVVYLLVIGRLVLVC